MKTKNTKYVIRGEKGTKFESCEVGEIGKEPIYESEEKAQIAIEQMQPYFRSEKLIIVPIS